MAKMGRPKSDSPKQKSIGVRLSDEDYAILKKYASTHDLTITGVIVKALKLLLQAVE